MDDSLHFAARALALADSSYANKEHKGSLQPTQRARDVAAMVLQAASRHISQAPLWCCHVRGPDDVHAAPDYATALALADMLNAMNWRDSSFNDTPKPRGFKDPANYADCLIKAVPAIWPHSAQSHAEDLPKSIAGFEKPAAAETA